MMTPPELAQQIINHFRPTGRMLEPCRGDGAFSSLMPGCHWFEINETEIIDRDFLTTRSGCHYDWIVTNPPYSKFRDFLLQSMHYADNIVFLAPINHFVTRARMRDIREKGFGIVEIKEYPQPPAPWPGSGFALGAAWLRRGWAGSTHIH